MAIGKNTKVKVSSSKSKRYEERLFIGTLGVNCLEFTRRCIDTVKINATAVRFSYIDNGSKPESCEKLKHWAADNSDIHEFAVAFNGRNAGVAVGWNQLIKQAVAWGATKILICNNDIVFGEHTINGLIESYDRLRLENEKTVMVTATNHTKNPNELKDIKPFWKVNEHPDFSCFLITPETIERIGYFCEDYDPAFFEDNDYHWRILMTGYKAFSSDLAPYSHIASRTRHGNPNIVTHDQFRGNKIKFFRNMLTLTVDQSVADLRYASWLNDNPTVVHPTVTQVLEYCIETGLVDAPLRKHLDGLTFESSEVR